MYLQISQEQLFQNKEDLVKREDVIWAVINAMSIPVGRSLSVTDMRILSNLIDLPAIKN
jgi:hypothetical protein